MARKGTSHTIQCNDIHEYEYHYSCLTPRQGCIRAFHDARGLVHSNFYKQAVAGEVLPASKTKLIGGIQVPPYILLGMRHIL